MLEARYSADDYAARVAADVAARYGLPVNPAVVQTVPTGTSGLPQAMWDGKHLIYNVNDGKPSGAAWRNRHRSIDDRRVGLVDPAVFERRAAVADLHRAGCTDAQIAETLRIEIKFVRSDRQHLKLRANIAAVRGPSTQTEIRLARIREMIAAGLEREAICLHLGLTESGLRYLAKHGRITLPTSPKKADVVAARRAARLRELSAAGATRLEMMADLGVASRTLRAVAERAGIVLPLDPPPRSDKRAAPKAVQTYPERDARQAAIGALNVAEMTVAEILTAMGGKITAHRLREDLRQLGLTPRRVASFSTEDRRAARLAALQAIDVTQLTVADLAERFGVSPRAMQNDLARLGLEPLRLPHGKSLAQMSALEARRGRIREMAAKGLSRNEIMAAEGIGETALYGHLKAMGLQLPRADGKRVIAKGAMAKPLMDDLRERVRALRLEGKTLSQISAAVGRSTGTVSHHLTVLGLTTKAGGK